MNRLVNNRVIKNASGSVRSGWIILIVYGLYYLIAYALTELLVDAMSSYFIFTGDLNPDVGYQSDLIVWFNTVGLSLIVQILTDVLMLAVPIVAWRAVMKNPLHDMGLISLMRKKKDLFVGMGLGFVCCSAVFVCIMAFGGGQIVSDGLNPSLVGLAWAGVFVLVALAEEIMNRGFIMAVLRRTRNTYFIVIVPSVIFGLIHLTNPGVSVLSVINIILIGIVFSYMFLKSGNIWMCIGYHFTWNTFQGVVYGMPVSGLDIPGLITVQFTNPNLVNGGAFGMEGGLMTTAVSLVAFAFVVWYYRRSTYNFIENRSA